MQLSIHPDCNTRIRVTDLGIISTGLPLVTLTIRESADAETVLHFNNLRVALNLRYALDELLAALEIHEADLAILHTGVGS